MKKTIFLFDLDKTLTKVELLPHIASLIKLKKQISDLTKEGVSGKTPFKKNFHVRVNILKHIDLKKIQRKVKDVPLDPYFLEFIQENHESCIIVTNNLDVWIAPIMEKYGFNYFSSKAKIVDGKVHGISSILNKGDVAKQFSNRHVVAIGDGINDFDMLKNADVSFLFNDTITPPKKLLNIVNYYSASSENICKILRQL